MNSKKRVNVIQIVTVITLCIFLFSCTKKQVEKSNESNPALIIGFSQIGAESAWRTCNTESMLQAAAQENIQMIYENAEQKQENQIKAIRSFIVYQVDAIVFVPIVQDGWDNVLQEAKDAHIPVIVLDRTINTQDESLYASYIGENSIEEGRNAARFLLRKYERFEGPFNIIEIRGTDGSSSSEGRHQGFCEIIDNDPRFKIVYSESGDFLRSRGKEIALDLVNKYKQQTSRDYNSLIIDGKSIDIIFSHNDGMTLGAIEVFEDNSINIGKDLTIVTVDAQQEAIDALKAHKINCVVECNPKQGPDCIELVKKMMENQIIPRIVHISGEVFSEFDDLSNIEPRGY